MYAKSEMQEKCFQQGNADLWRINKAFYRSGENKAEVSKHLWMKILVWRYAINRIQMAVITDMLCW